MATRRSPRKKQDLYTIPNPEAGVEITVEPRRQQLKVECNAVNTTRRQHKAQGLGQPQNVLGNIPNLLTATQSISTVASSCNRSSPKSRNRRNVPIRVDSVFSDFANLTISTGPQRGQVGDNKQRNDSNSKSKENIGRAGKISRRNVATKNNSLQASCYVYKEARCPEDEENSDLEHSEDDDTDLSGFIVDDNADLSYHEWSGSDTETRSRKQNDRTEKATRRRLYRGGAHRRDTTTQPQMGTKTADRNNIEVIDLTSSPAETLYHLNSAIRDTDLFTASSEKTEPRPDQPRFFSKILRFSPPRHSVGEPQVAGEADVSFEAQQSEDLDSLRPEASLLLPRRDRCTTPPTTPPRSPSKLKSPSKLLSPAKREVNLRSPHRQSTDAFWDHNVINQWHDINSPKKAPLGSPVRKGLARFQIWTDASEDEESRISDDSLPSPCDSPTKPRSPLKNPEKAQKQQIAASRKAGKLKKATFDANKKSLAQQLFHELDTNITSSKLSTLSATNGGVQLTWSKTLRSTAGRANWRRTVTKNSSSPIKGDVIKEGPGVTIEHFASIELADKVIDCEERLVNTLAHEFCHLANFMVSNVRDRPHGAEFKEWAGTVTRHLKKSDNELWRKVEVTTKHDYKIDYKYLWVCVGRHAVRGMELGGVGNRIGEEEGCGAEYGRHSKSIDPEKSRCGRCKGKLVQVRPKPRGSPVKKNVGPTNWKEKMMEIVELSD